MTRPSILIVEDDPVTMLYLRDLLEFRMYRVVGTAPDGPGAIALAAREQPDLILMDVILKRPYGRNRSGHADSVRP